MPLQLFGKGEQGRAKKLKNNSALWNSGAARKNSGQTNGTIAGTGAALLS
jgi:hypothetical protein